MSDLTEHPIAEAIRAAQSAITIRVPTAADGVETDSQTRQKMPFETESEWHKRMSDAMRWPILRACQDDFTELGARTKFLLQYPFEDDAHYKYRVAEAPYLGVCESAVERLTGALFASEPVFTVPSNSELEAWASDVDGRGTSLRTKLEQYATEAAWMGAMAVLVTRPPGSVAGAVEGSAEGSDVTQADEEAAGLRRALLKTYEVEEIWSWYPDDDPEWIVFRTVVTKQASPSESPRTYVRFRIVDAMKIEDWEIEIDDKGREKGDMALVQSVEHTTGVVPVQIIHGQRLTDMTGLSLVKGGARADLAKLREDSFAGTARARHANPFLAIKSSRPIKELIAGGGAVRLETDEDAKYLVIDKGSFDIREQAAERFTREGHRMTGANPSFTTEGMTFQGESGVASKQRFNQTERRRIDDAAANLQHAATRLLRLAAAVIDGSRFDPKLDVSVQVITSAEVMDVADRANVYTRVGLEIPSPTFHRYMARTLAAGMMGDAPKAILDAVKAEIEAADFPLQPDPNDPNSDNPGRLS